MKVHSSPYTSCILVWLLVPCILLIDSIEITKAFASSSTSTSTSSTLGSRLRRTGIFGVEVEVGKGKNRSRESSKNNNNNISIKRRRRFFLPFLHSSTRHNNDTSTNSNNNNNNDRKILNHNQKHVKNNNNNNNTNIRQITQERKKPNNHKQNSSSHHHPHQEIELVDINWLKTHEEVLQNQVQKLKRATKRWKEYRLPLLVDSKSGAILDGHHRYHVGRQLGLSRLPVVLVDYLVDERIDVDVWPECGVDDICKEDVIEMSLSDDVFPPKTSKHDFVSDLRPINVPLSDLI